MIWSRDSVPSKQRVGSSNLPGRATFLGSNPETWVAECTGYIGNNLGPNGLSLPFLK